MTEDEARAWLDATFDVPRETWGRLERYVGLLLDGMAHQNLIAESTVPHIWSRHIVDCAQLLLHTRSALADGLWIDLGAGAGLPGVVIAILSPRPVLMIESRRKRVDFLNMVIADLALPNARILGGRVENAPPCKAAVLSARAYAPLERLFASAAHLSGPASLWVLPKGRNAQNELEVARASWQADATVEPSVTDPESAIILARSVSRVRRNGRS